MEQVKSQPSFARWWRQICFVPMLHGKWVTAEFKQRITQKVTEAEQGHSGEVYFIIENNLPVASAYRIDCRERAINLFAEHRVWDTEENTGVLVYVNVCEHTLDIVADRGINAHVSPSIWKAMCDKAVAGLAKGEVEQSLSELLNEIGQLLRQYYQLKDDPEGNELSDTVVHLR